MADRGVYFEIDATEYENAAAALTGAGFDEDRKVVMDNAVMDATVITRRRVRNRLSRHRRTGRLQSQVKQAFTRGANGDLYGHVWSGGRIAHLINEGVRPHEIRSLNPMPIRSHGSLVAFAQAVQHPGFSGDRYFHKGVEDARGDIQDIANAAAVRMTKLLAVRMAK